MFLLSPDNRNVERMRQEFLAETYDGLDRMERCLTELETRPADMELIGEIFRAVHTLKGTTSFLGYKRVERLAHAGEQLIGDLRTCAIVANREVISVLLALMDALRLIVGQIEKTRSEGDETDEDLIERLVRLRRREAQISELLGQQAAVKEPFRQQEEPARTVPGHAAGSEENTPFPPPGSASEKTLRIDVEVLNRMMNLVGELVLTRNQMLRSGFAPEDFPELARRLDSVTAELRGTVMQARMQPVGQLFGRFPRILRDLAASCGKRVRLELSGQGTGLDKSLLEAIKDPLTHAIRNAVDHGIEPCEARLKAGKLEEGVIRLRACHRSGWVVLEMEDDGAGISRKKVLAKAVERGLVTEVQASGMSNRETLQLIFLPGFSTAGKVTHISGRGVGMDVVKNNVERIGGTVEIESEEGRGTLLRMRVPLTLAILPALVVESCGQSFCLPQGALAELVYVPRAEAETLVERIGDAQLFHIRGSLLPIVWLNKLLEVSDSKPCPAHGFYIAVLELEGFRFGLAVDELLAPEEIVVKPLTSGLREIGLFSGATVLGNGELAMILDIMATAARAGIRPLVELPKRSEEQVAEVPLPLPEFLVFEGRMHGTQSERIALPLQWVERIETVSRAQVEWACGKPKLQYRGDLLALEDVGHVLDEETDGYLLKELTVLICHVPDAAKPKRTGMIVRRVLDVASGAMLPESDGRHRFAMVRDKLAVIQEDPALTGRLQEVA